MVKHLVAGSVRNAVLDRAALQSQHKHEQRQDFKGRLRTINDTPPLIYKAGSSAPDMVSAYDEWSAGCRRNKAAADNLALHAMVHFPSDLIPLDGTPAEIARAEKFMLNHAVQFINERNGGDAVFWARLDRDEKGRHNVDVFYAPRYTKHTKSKGEERWISLTKFDKEKALERYGQVPKLDVRRTAGGKKVVLPSEDKSVPGTSLFWRGKALQTDFYEYLRDTARIAGVERGEEKHTHGKDWQSVEDYKAQKEASKVNELQRRGMRMQRQIKEQQRQIKEQKETIKKQDAIIKRTRTGPLSRFATAKKRDIDEKARAITQRFSESMDKKNATINQQSREITALKSRLETAQQDSKVLNVLRKNAHEYVAAAEEFLKKPAENSHSSPAIQTGHGVDAEIMAGDDEATRTLKQATNAANAANRNSFNM
jgi:hypothetical protein